MQGRLVASLGRGFALIAVFAIGCAGGDGPSGPAGTAGAPAFGAARNAVGSPTCNPPVAGTTNICTTAPYTAGANETAVVNVSASAFVPAGTHALGVYAMYSTDNGATWAGVHGVDTIAGTNGTVGQNVSAANSGVLALTSGTTYVFATGVWDAPGAGWSGGCNCSTTAYVAKSQ